MEIAPFVPNIVERGFFEVNPYIGYIVAGLVISIMLTCILHGKNDKNKNKAVEFMGNVFGVLIYAFSFSTLLFGIVSLIDYSVDDSDQYREQQKEYVDAQMQKLEDNGIEVLQGTIPANYNTREDPGTAQSMVLKSEGKVYDCLVSYPANLDDNLVFSCSPLADMKLEDIMAGK